MLTAQLAIYTYNQIQEDIMFIVKKITLAIIASSFLLSSAGYANSNGEEGFNVLDALREYTYIAGDFSEEKGISKANSFVITAFQGGVVEAFAGGLIFSEMHEKLLNKALTPKLVLTDTKGKEKRNKKVLEIKKITQAEMKTYLKTLTTKERLKIKAAKTGAVITISHGFFVFLDSYYMAFSDKPE